MIRMINGACLAGGKLMRSVDGPFSLPEDTEKRLVRLGAAEYAEETALPHAAMPGEVGYNGGAGAAPPEEENTAPGMEEPGSDLPADESAEGIALNDTLDVAEGHITKDSLLRLTRSEMEKLADDLNIDVSKCKNKGEIAELLSAVEVQPLEPEKEEETPPALSAEGPVL